MSQPFDADAHVAHMARAMDLPIDPAWLPAVTAHMAVTAAIAEDLMAFALDDTVEIAPVFEP